MATNWDLEPEIYCPKCRYVPKVDDRWECAPTGCGTKWNTFWTRGLCPGCARQWDKTQCPQCHKTSLHKAWYHLPVKKRAKVEREAAQPG